MPLKPECLLYRYPRPIRVEILEQRDEEDGLTEKFVQRNEGFRKDREKEPRFAPPGSFEFEFGNKHRQIDEMEKDRIERSKQEMENERTRLAEEMETAIFDYQADQIRQGKFAYMCIVKPDVSSHFRSALLNTEIVPSLVQIVGTIIFV